MPQLDGSSPSSWVICCLRKGINRKLEGKWYSEDSNELSTFCFFILARTSQKRYAHLWTSYQQAYSVTISWLLILYLITCLVQHLHSKLAGFPFRVDWHPVGKYFLTQCLISHHTIIQQFSIHLWLLHGNFLFFFFFLFLCVREAHCKADLSSLSCLILHLYLLFCLFIFEKFCSTMFPTKAESSVIN